MADEESELPVELLDAMERVESAINNCNDILGNLTNDPLLDTKKKLEPIERARLDLTTAYTINSLFWAYLVTQGVNATDHPVKSELDRIKTYMSKVKDTEEKVKGATLKVDKEAAKRFIKSALWTEKDKTKPKSSDGSPEDKVDIQQQQTSVDSEEKDTVHKRKLSEECHTKKKKKKKKVKQE